MAAPSVTILPTVTLGVRAMSKKVEACVRISVATTRVDGERSHPIAPAFGLGEARDEASATVHTGQRDGSLRPFTPC